MIGFLLRNGRGEGDVKTTLVVVVGGGGGQKGEVEGPSWSEVHRMMMMMMMMMMMRG